jgi:hypothetical protein
MWASEEAFKIYGLDRRDGYIPLPLARKWSMWPIGQNGSGPCRFNQWRGPLRRDLQTARGHGKTKYIHSMASLFSDDDHDRQGFGDHPRHHEIKIKELELNYISQHDYLTNLFNRRYFMDNSFASTTRNIIRWA